MLEIKNVYKTFNAGTVNEKVALKGLDLTLEDGDFVTVIGGNGAGKSTMLNAVAGVWPVDMGKIVIDGQDVTRLSEHQRAKYIGRVFQDPMMGTAATMQIDENLALAARRGLARTLKTGITKKEHDEYYELLKTLDLGLENRMTSKVGLLSGGQRQAVTLLMATLKKPKNRRGKPPDHPDDHPQHEGRHQVRQPPDHDVRGPRHLRCEGRGKEEPSGQQPAAAL